MTAQIPEQAVTAAVEAITARMTYPAATTFAQQRLRELATAALEATVPVIRDHLISQLAIADTTTCGECNYPLHRCPDCRHLIGHDGYDDHQCYVRQIDSHREVLVERVAELEQLARDILSHFIASGDGHRARVGQVQIAKWQTALDSQP